MKNIVLILIAAFLAAPVAAQTALASTEMRADTVEITIEKEKVVVIEENDGWRTETITYNDGKCKKKKSDKVEFTGGLAMLDFGWSNYMDKNFISGQKGDEFLDLNTAKSINLAWYVAGLNAKITRSKALVFQTALGLDWTNFRFEDGWSIDRENGMTVASPKYLIDGVSQVSKSKLMTLYLNLPVMVRWNIPLGSDYKHHLYLATGAIGGLRLGSHTKAKYYDNTTLGSGKVKDKDSFNLNMLTYDLTLRAGYRGFGVFFNYQMTPMFEKNKGPRVFPYSVGISITEF